MMDSFKIKFTAVVLLLILWQVTSFFYDPLILPSPVETGRAIYNIVVSGQFHYTALTTLLNTLFGVILALLCGIFVGVLSGLSKAIYAVFHPLIIVLQSTPVISWILLALVWFSNEIIPVVLVMFTCIPIVIVNISEGIRNVDKKLLEMAKIYKIERFKIIREIYLPSVLSQLLSSTRLILGLSFKVAVMAEVVGRVKGGIGEKLNWAWINIETPEIIAWTIIVIVVTFLVEYSIMKLIALRQNS